MLRYITAQPALLFVVA